MRLFLCNYTSIFQNEAWVFYFWHRLWLLRTRHRICPDLILISSFSGLALVIGIVFYLSNINSPLCSICGEATNIIDKRIFLLKNNGDDKKSEDKKNLQWSLKNNEFWFDHPVNEVLLYAKISFQSRNLATSKLQRSDLHNLATFPEFLMCELYVASTACIAMSINRLSLSRILMWNI